MTQTSGMAEEGAPRSRTGQVWFGVLVGLVVGAGISTLVATPDLWRPLLPISAPDPIVLPASIGIGNYAVAVPPARNLTFLDMTAPYKALAEASYDDVWETSYLWRPDRPLHSRETRKVAGGPATLIELLDESAEAHGWARDDRFRHEGWSITTAGYERDGYLFAIAILGRRAAHMEGEQLIVGTDADAQMPPGAVLPVAVITNLPRPLNPTTEAPWIAPDAWRAQ